MIFLFDSVIMSRDSAPSRDNLRRALVHQLRSAASPTRDPNDLLQCLYVATSKTIMVGERVGVARAS